MSNKYLNFNSCKYLFKQQIFIQNDKKASIQSIFRHNTEKEKTIKVKFILLLLFFFIQTLEIDLEADGRFKKFIKTFLHEYTSRTSACIAYFRKCTSKIFPSFFFSSIAFVAILCIEFNHTWCPLYSPL